MPHNAPRDPCRIVDSDSEDERDNQVRSHIQFLTRPVTPKPPRIADWSSPTDEPNFDKPQYPDRTFNTPIENGRLQPTSRISSGSSTSASSLEPTKPQLSFSVSTTTPESPPTSPTTAQSSNFDPVALLQGDINQFIYTTVPKDFPSYVQCRLRRDKDGVQGGFFPTFYLQVERPSDNKKFFILAARKVAKVNRQIEYVITTNVETLSKGSDGEGCVGKLRGNNMSGTEYTLFDNGSSPNKSSSKHSNNKEDLRRQLAAVVYSVNILGIKGPRQISAMIPQPGQDIQPARHESGILEHWKDRRLNYFIQLRNKSPKYNEETKAYVLQFIGNRVAKPSVKNFQMVIENENHEEQVAMQFGRVDKDIFSCDFRYPLSAIQAFAIALSSFDSRLTRE
ncbi:unnamed protein product [Rotaria socialis]|uniref:Tubby C-terminal domain-containing protein n=1 Tax=Rotaria socialis TaxID=392032 RepID=A0A819C4A3_9BILA|nr:unnamed protein product [Rotaria socialis]CAF4756656.1 unnamed protein product [Rotaria socialis]